MRAFNSLSRELSAVSQVWGHTGLKTRVMNNLLATFCLHFTRTFFGGPSSHVSQPGYVNIHIAHAQYACYRTLYSSVIADSFVKYREKENKQGINVVLSRQSRKWGRVQSSVTGILRMGDMNIHITWLTHVRTGPPPPPPPPKKKIAPARMDCHGAKQSVCLA